MKILIYTNIIPFPLDEGGKVAQYVFIESLVKDLHEVTLVSAGTIGHENQLLQLKKKLPQLNTRFINEELGRERISFKQKIIRILAWEFKKRVEEPYENPLLKDSEGFMQPVKYRGPLFVAEWEKIIEELMPDMVQVDFIGNADLALLIPPSCKKVMIMHDLKFASVKQAAQLSGLSTSFTNYLSGYVKTTETAFLNLFDAILTFSKEDAQQLSDTIDPDKLHIAPFSVLGDKFNQLNESAPISKLVFIGPDHHYPNLDAIHWYAESIGPLLYDKLGFKLIVVGKWSEANKAIFHKKEFIQFEGFVEDIDKVFKNAALLVPLRIGSGIRTKIIEAFAMGVPVVTTTLGGEGLDAMDGKEILIANDADQFLHSIERLVTDPEFTNNICHRAQELAAMKYSQSATYQLRMDIYHKLIR